MQGYAGQPNQDLYHPFLLTSLPGDSLRIDLDNQLPANSPPPLIDLHTHGLIVDPRPCTPFGDYIFATTEPGGTSSYRIDIPQTLPGLMFDSSAPQVPYPSGLYWFHVHMHGTTEPDVMMGQAGMLYIGDLHADLLATPGISAQTEQTLLQSDIVYLGLRDLQLDVPSGITPDVAQSGTGANWVNTSQYDTQACRPASNPGIPMLSGPGYCGHRDLYNLNTNQYLPGRDTVWLFTINGQSFPDITLQPGRHHIWRIANMSSDVTYVLQLVDDATGDLQTLDVLAVDGIVAASTKASSAEKRVGVPVKYLLLLPASRAEIYVQNTASDRDRSFTFRTGGIVTGNNPPGTSRANLQGDPWPAVNLAHVVMRAPPPGSAVPSELNIPMANSSPSSGATPASMLGVAPPNCVTLPPGQVVRRRITFVETDAVPFGIGSTIVRPDGTPIDDQHTIPPQAFPEAAMTAPNSLPHICPRLNKREVWEVVNITSELHNFHLHQVKFRLAVQTDPGVPPNLVPIVDPTGLIAKYTPEAQGAAQNAAVDLFHDTLPIPPADANGNPGRLFISVPFFATEQIGTYVMHCHVLAHEDGGMMAVVEAYDPKQTAQANGSGLATNQVRRRPTAPDLR